MSIIEEGNPQHVRMAYLAVVGSHCVNGVAALHSELVQTVLLKEFVDFFGKEKFTNVTNGVTPRRWLHQANPGLSGLLTEYLKDTEWIRYLDNLESLKYFADDPVFTDRWMDIKKKNKVSFFLKQFNFRKNSPNLFSLYLEYKFHQRRFSMCM